MCPFCGTIPETEVMVTQMGSGTDYVDFSVVCPNCRTNKTIRLKIAKTASFNDVYNIMKDVKDKWNRRAISE